MLQVLLSVLVATAMSSRLGNAVVVGGGGSGSGGGGGGGGGGGVGGGVRVYRIGKV